MSDTMDFLSSSPDAVPPVSSDIDLEALAGNLDQLTDDELVSIMEELDLPIQDSAEEARTMIRRHLDEEAGTANVIDITHAKVSGGAPTTPMVDTVSDNEIDNRVVSTSRLWWQNPYTGNKIPHGQRDTDGRGNVDGFSVPVNAENPIDSPIYDDE